ncbi:MAG: 16S rRNA (guanine(966)-N(2))-methyltransferase RsmD [Methylococcales bacterium]|nr:16S rRNA (guanine(966)-N(2))-methyltransferase RsmD [Methylococcales bacterium]
MSNRLRIIGGEWRSRQIVFADAPGLRPTPARVRETLFNWLRFDVANSRCLDLFAGSGALGFEAASRGAKRVVQVENNPKVSQKLRENIALLAAGQMTVATQDASQYLQGVAECFDLVFMDPPFAQSLVQPSCHLLEQNGWLADNAKIYIEAERQFDPVGMPAGWRLHKHKTAGEVGFYLFQR